MARLIETDNFTNKDISAAVSIGSYTATAVRLVHVRVLVNQAAGNGDYIIYATITKSAVEYRVIPITTAAAASGLTALAFVSLAIPVDVNDVLQVYIDGLAGDTATPDTQVDFYEKDYLRPTTAGRTLDVSATGEAGLDFDNVKAATAPTTLTNITVPVVTTLTNMPAAAPSAATIAAEILVTPANKLATGAAGIVTAGGGTINSVSGTVTANVVQMNGETDPVDNLVLALGNSSGVMISNAAVDAVWDEAISGHLTAGTTGAKLNTASSASGSGSTAYTNTVTDDSSNPLDGVEVWITSDSGGASTVASTTTNTLGSFTVYLDPGTYYLWCAKGGINFPNPTTITVS